jgi:hypothetical protein
VHGRTATTSLIAKVRGEVFAHVHAVAVEITLECGLDCLACQDKFFVNNPLDVKGSDERALHLCRLFLSRRVRTFPMKHPCTTQAFISDRTFNHCQGLRCTSPRCAQSWAGRRCEDPSRSPTRPDTRHQIKGYKH